MSATPRAAVPSAAASSPFASPPSAPWADADAAFFAEQLARSDYARNLGDTLRALYGGRPRSLIDIGAGSGLLGQAVIARGGRWCAIEPNAHMRGRLAGLAEVRPDLSIEIRDAVWQELAPADPAAPADLVLCANIPGPIGQARALHARTRPLGRMLAWIVPAQAGPRSWCLAGFLPSHLHGEDITPGDRLALDELGGDLAPDTVHLVPWTFRALFPDRAAARAHMLDHLGRRGHVVDDLEARLDRHLDLALVEADGGVIAEAPKLSAVFLWHS
ncbi:class I SAM-dependent methyltransferase [Tistrella mobilis]|uniref:class I SAM-dependent methyltransferase n=1 Tax=Tistrella mobilis TaxID=171437 RepID=UPI0035582B7E